MSGRPNKDDRKLPTDFVNYATKLVGVHLAVGNWEAAVEAVNYAKQLWDERCEPDQLAGPEMLALHVSYLKLDARTLNYVERVCSGTIGSLIENFPRGFESIRGVGLETIKTIASELVRIRALGRKDAADRVRKFHNAT